jgi:hypothetical protein
LSITVVADRQRVAIFGVEQEEKPEKQAQAGVSDFRPPNFDRSVSG